MDPDITPSSVYDASSLDASSYLNDWSSRTDRLCIDRNEGYLTAYLNLSKLLNELDGQHMDQWISNHALRLITKTVFSDTKEFIATLRQHNDLTYPQLRSIYNALKHDIIHNAVQTAVHSQSQAKTAISSFTALSMIPYKTANDPFENGMHPLPGRCLNIHQTYHSLLLKPVYLGSLPISLQVPKQFNAYTLLSNSRVRSGSTETIEITESNCLSVSRVALTLKNPHSSRGDTVYFNVFKMTGLEDVYFIAPDLKLGNLKLVTYKARSLEAGCIHNCRTQLQTIFGDLIKKKMSEPQGLGIRAFLSSFISLHSAYVLFTRSASANNNTFARDTLNVAKQTQLVKVDAQLQRVKAKTHKDATIEALNAMMMQRFMLQSFNRMDTAPYLGAWSDEDLTWLNINKLLNELDEARWISNHALRFIIETVFSSTKVFITATLSQHNDLTYRQLNTIYNILKYEMLHNPINAASHSIVQAKTVSFFTALSIPSITNICSYLTKEDILSFKNTSTNIAIIALREMSKYHIGVFNMNELFDHYNNFSVLTHIKTRDVIKNERYSPSMTFKKIIEVWSKHYDIKSSNMALICIQSDKWLERYFSFLGKNPCALGTPFIQFALGEDLSTCFVITKTSDISDFRVKQMKRERFDYFLVLDKTKMSVLCDIEHENKCNDDACEVLYDKSTEWSCSKCTFINPLSDNVCGMCDNEMPSVPDNAEFNVLTQRHEQQCLILLNYFDLKQQKILLWRALIVHKEYSLNDLKSYIAKNTQLWIPECDDELSRLLNDMKAYNNVRDAKDSLIRMYKYTDTDTYAVNSYVLKQCDKYLQDHGDVRERVEMYVFQLNPSHHWIKYIYISKLRVHNAQIFNESFCVDPSALVDGVLFTNNSPIKNIDGAKSYDEEEKLYFYGLGSYYNYFMYQKIYKVLDVNSYASDSVDRNSIKHLDNINKQAKQKRIRKDISHSVKYQKKMSKKKLYKAKKYHYHRW